MRTSKNSGINTAGKVLPDISGNIKKNGSKSGVQGRNLRGSYDFNQTVDHDRERIKTTPGLITPGSNVMSHNKYNMQTIAHVPMPLYQKTSDIYGRKSLNTGSTNRTKSNPRNKFQNGMVKSSAVIS